MTSTIPNPDPSLIDTTSQPDDHSVSIPRTSAATLSSSDSEPSGMSSDLKASPDCLAREKVEQASFDAMSKMSNLLKDREKEWTAVAERKGPLRLLDLPMDVLKEIVKEVTHTNDLTALALTHSALHNLSIPHIYSRFDIVWPDAHATTDPRTGVDALTYGLATLCMGDIYAAQTYTFPCTKCGALNTAPCSHEGQLEARNFPRRFGNQYPQFTRKFSLGNGPADWVQEYLITKESGKMLGTLVALAVARMINLETFVWDMPTGVLRDVWLALSSLQNRNTPQGCRLERVWVRWHDNTEETANPLIQSSATPSNVSTAGGTLTSIGWAMPSDHIPASQSHPRSLSSTQNHVEYPTLSVLPPLKSLSVLDIDEVDYLDEMSTLIEKSRDRLRELRVGISTKAVGRDFAIAWDGPCLYQVDHDARCPAASRIGDRRLGGVLGILLGRVFNIRKKQKPKTEQGDLGSLQSISQPIPSTTVNMDSGGTMPIDGSAPPLTMVAEDLTEGDKGGSVTTEGALKPLGLAQGADHLPFSNDSDNVTVAPSQLDGTEQTTLDVDSLTAQISASTIHEQSHNAVPSGVSTEGPIRRSRAHSQKETTTTCASSPKREKLDGRLRLQTLELEHVSLSVAVLQKAFDWSILANLTILDCPQHDRLWVMLRRQFVPTPPESSHSSAKQGGAIPLQYHLNLRKIHTDAASPALISFLKETLAPNTLETLFLQDRRRGATSNVTVDAIYRGPLKRHRGSLRKLMLDSSDRIPRGPTSASDNTRWRAWVPNRDVLNFITSGRMSSLRELSMAIDYKDWHHFLQRLPQIPHLRSLNIPFVADHVTPAFDPRELALQVVDVIVLRPEVELCYMGISHKCFEILENRPHDEVHGTGDHASLANGGPESSVFTDDDDEGSEDEGSDEDDGQDEDSTAIAAPVDPDETESEVSDHDDSDTDSFDGSDDIRSKVRLRLREILFYDDKVAIFRARHGKL